MKVKDLIAALNSMPDDAQVLHLWDGASRTSIEIVYLARSGAVITSAFGMSAYYDEDRPHNAPTSKQDPYWETPKALRPTPKEEAPNAHS